jgi:D-glycero-beta-D-manno-heptose-7-phosphate kinase
MKSIANQRTRQLLRTMQHARVLVVGDVMLDQFLWGRVARISPEAPVPVVEMVAESYMPGGAANVARNLTALGAAVELFGVIGSDASGEQLKSLLESQHVRCQGLVPVSDRPTSVKTRIIAHQQQVVRVDREKRGDVSDAIARRLWAYLRPRLAGADAVIVGDYGKGAVTQTLLEQLKRSCRAQGVWLSLDPKPVHHLDLTGLSLITPNRKEAFELADQNHDHPAANPLRDASLRRVADQLLHTLGPALLLITLGEQGMLLCQQKQAPVHIPTMAREVFDVSGAGDTVIASFTLALAAGASPLEAALVSNHAAGVVVGKKGTATVSPDELRASLAQKS